MSALSDYLAGITPDSPYIENNNSDSSDDNSWKYLSAGDIGGYIDYTDRTYDYRHIPFLGQLAGHMTDAAMQVLADTSQYLNLPKTGNYFNKVAQRGEDDLPPMTTPEMSLAYLTDPNGLTSAFGQGVGSMLPGALFAKVLPTSGLAAKVSDMVSQAPKVGGLLSGLAKGGVRWAPTAIPEAMSEAGNTERTMLQDGASPENAQAAANQVFAGNAKLLAGTNFLEGGLLGGLHVKIPKVSNNGVLNGLAQAGGYIPSTLAETALQGFEEGEQQGIQNSAEGKAYSYNPAQWTADQTEQAKFGVAASLPMIGGLAGARALSRRFGNKALPEDIQQMDAGAPPDDAGKSDSGPDAPDAQVPDAVDAGFEKYDGQRMQNGRNGCVEAVGKIGSAYSSFLAKENEAGQVNVSGLVSDAQNDGVPVIPFDESKLQKGDVIVFGDEDHVLISDGNGGYYGNSSNADGPDAGGHVLHGNDIYSLGDNLQPTKIIKTGSGDYQAGFSGQSAAANETQQPENESSKPLFDMNDDSMLEQFAENMKESASDPETINYFNGMFKENRKGQDVFRATDEQKQDMQQRYAAELDDFVTTKDAEALQAQLAQQKNRPAYSNQLSTAIQTHDVPAMKSIITQQKALAEARLQQAKVQQPMQQVVAPYKTMAPYRTIPGVPAQTRVHTENNAMPARPAEGVINHENNQISSTATPAQDRNAEDQHENAVPQQSPAATEENQVTTAQRSAQSLAHMARTFGVPANYQAISQAVNSGDAQRMAKATNVLYHKLAERGVDVTNINSPANARLLDQHLSQSAQTMAAFDANPVQAVSSLPHEVQDAVAKVAGVKKKGSGSLENYVEKIAASPKAREAYKEVNHLTEPQDIKDASTKTAVKKEENLKVSDGDMEKYRSEADSVMQKLASKEINKSRAVQSLKDILGEINKDYWDRKISAAERTEAQAYASNVLGKVNEQQKTKSQKRKDSKDSSTQQRVFADKETADTSMLKAFGMEKQEEAPQTLKQRSWAHKTDEEKAALKEQISKEMKHVSALPFFNPKLMVPAFKLAAAYIDDGIVKFSAFSSKMVSDFGKEIVPWLRSIWNAAVSYDGETLDEGKLTMMMQSVGARYEDGLHTYKEIYDDISGLMGKENSKSVEPYIKTAFNSVEAYYNDNIPAMAIKEDGVNESDVRAGGMAERSGKGTNQDSVGRHDENEGSGRGGVESVQPSGTEVRAQRGVRVWDSSASAGGKIGDSRVQTEKSRDRRRSAGSPELSRSVRNSYERDTSLDDGRRGRDIKAPENRRDNESHSLKKESGNKKKAGSLEASIEHDLPMLLPEQRGDVLFMERRLSEKGKQGIMLTNGTGTGKTFSGMGLVKRMVGQGKKNILIVTPGDEVNKQWVKAAKDFFHIDIHTLKDENDVGKGVTITTYANYGSNKALVSRNWDMIIHDESQKLMENEKGKNTLALEKLRALTYHKRGLRGRFKLLHPDEYKQLDQIVKRMQDKEDPVSESEYKRLDNKRGKLYSKLSTEENSQIAEWEQIPQQDKPKVVMLSATPFSRVTNIDYAEGYLFDYGDKQSDGYNDTDAKEQFFVQHFGYRMRDNKLTKPDANVDNSLMEMEFYDWLKSTGAVTGRSINIDKDYDRGFLLIPNAVGTMMDKGFDALREDNRFKNLYEVLDKTFTSRKRNYLLEFIKAKEAVPVIREYLKRGKKVVVFHQAMKSQEVSNPFLLPDHFPVENNEIRDRVQQEYALFQSEHPELYRNNMGMDGLSAPAETMQQAFGDKAGFYNGSAAAKRQVKDAKGNKLDARSSDIAEFNDDRGSKKVLVVQQDAGNAGISLHDTTGKFQRVLINLAIPKRPTYAIQTEGRIYRVGSASNAIIRYLTTGTDLEKSLFASTVASRSSTAENLSMGSAARNLRDSFRDLYMETMDGSWGRRKPGHADEGTGGKIMDTAANDAITDYDRAKTYYYGQQKRTAAMKSLEGNDYFATPEPIGYKMVEWAKHPDEGSILEPSAGHGAISQWFAPNSDQTIIEPSGKLAPLAQMNTPNAKLIQDSFENHNIVNKYDSVVMNPPFGSGGKTAIEHVAKAFKHLRDGGRLVAIIPEGASCQKHLDTWLYGNPDGKTKAERGEESAVLMQTVDLPAVAFERAGTKVMTKIIIIDKQNDKTNREAAAAESGGEIDLRGEKDINSLFDRMENIPAPDRVIPSASLQAVVNNEDISTSPAVNGSKTLDINGNEVTVHPDGYVTGDTYPVKKDIKSAGARWDNERKEWHFTDPVKMKEFINSYSDEKVEITEADRKTSEAIFAFPDDTTAWVKKRLNYAEGFQPLKSLAAKFGGKYQDQNGFTFPDKINRDHFVVEAEAFLAAHDGSVQASANGRVSSMMDSVEFVSDDSLNGRQKAISEFSENMGVPVVFFDGHPDLHGFHSQGITFLNRKSAVSIPWTFWHETFHWMKAENPKLYADMVKYISGKEGFAQEQLDAYREEIGRPELSDADVIEEMMADAMPEVKRRVSFMQALGRENMTLAQRFVAWVKDIMDRVCDAFHTPVVGFTNTQIAAFKESFTKLARDMVDAEGRHLFQVNIDKHDIRLASGQLLESVKYSLDNSDNKADNENERINITEESKDRIFRDVVKRMDGRTDYLKRNGMDDVSIDREFTDDNSDSRKVALRNFQTYYNQFSSPRTNKRNLVERITHNRNLSNDEVNDLFSQFKVKAKEMLDYAGFIYKESSLYGRGNGKNVVGFHSWQEVEQSNADHGGSYGTKTENSLNEKHSDNQGAFSIGNSETSWLQSKANVLAQKLHLRGDKIIVEEQAKKKDGEINLKQYTGASPSRIADKVTKFRLFYDIGDMAMNKLTKLRSEFLRKLAANMDIVKDAKDKEDLFRILWAGDAEAKEYGKLTNAEMDAIHKEHGDNTTTRHIDAGRIKKIMAETECSENAAKAYIGIRRLMTKAYNMLNEARGRVQNYSKYVVSDAEMSKARRKMKDEDYLEYAMSHISRSDVEDLKNNKFANIISEDGDLINYRARSSWKHSYADVTKEALKRMEQDDAIQVLSSTEAGRDDNGNQLYDVEARETVSDIHKRGGYIPHFFHEQMLRIKDGEGKIVDTIGSARTQAEAVKLAEAWLKNNKLANGNIIYVMPKMFDFGKVGMSEKDYAPIMGDKDFRRMQENIAEKNEISLNDAKAMVDGAVRQKNRNRFYGNFIHRTGVKGFETDMGWVLRHYFNSVSRYVAMETYFKPKAISMFERIFGAFDKSYSGSTDAQYIKDYINDINGNPSALENVINNALNRSKIFQKYFIPMFGDRAALGLANSVTNTVSWLTLGCGSVSSVLINLTQLMNATAYIGDASSLVKMLKKGMSRKYDIHDMKILIETGVMNDIGLDSSNGYDKNRGYSGSSISGKIGTALSTVGWLGNKTMIPFQAIDSVCRRGTALAAYESAIKRGMSHDAAIKFAKSVNLKSNFSYAAADAPNIFRRGSIISQLALQFKKYGFKEMEVVMDMFPGNKATSRKQKMLFWGLYFMAAGLMGFPALDWLDDLFGKANVFPKDFVQKGIMELCGDSWEGKILGKVAMYGILGAFNINISNRAGLSDVIPTRISDLSGPALSKMYNLGVDTMSGNYASALRDVSPGMYNYYAAFLAGSSHGKRDRTNTVYDGAYEKLLRATGFKSVDESLPVDIERIIRHEQSAVQQEKQKAIDDYLDNPTTANAARLRELHVRPATVQEERARKKMDRLSRMKSRMSANDVRSNADLLKFAK